jgi:uncharacterized membrane protein
MKNVLILATLFFVSLSSFAHGSEDHSKSAKTETAIIDSVKKQDDTTQSKSNEVSLDVHHDMDMSAFSTYHPLIVHFPIVLLIILPFFQLVSFFRLKKEIGWAVIILTGLGFITAYLASNNFHPHTTGLPPQASKILEEHDYFAYLTVWISLATLVTKLASQFVFKLNKWSEYVVLIFLFLAAYFVIMAGHHGSQLTHIYGVGAEGKYIMKHH